MSTRIPVVLTTGLCLLALGGAAGPAAARQGADDPAGHVRHGQGADDASPGSRERRAHRRRHRSGGRHRHGADDRGARRGGRDDAPGHR